MFLLINKTISNSFFDFILPYWRESKIWIPLYVVILCVAIKENKKNVWLWIVFALFTVFTTDQISSHVLKPYFQRLRPYEDPAFLNNVRLLVPKIGRGFSFTSSHATNHFGICIFFIYTLISINKLKIWFIFWASMVCLAQIYVGVHYPFDVICGAFLGSTLGAIMVYLYKNIKNKYLHV